MSVDQALGGGVAAPPGRPPTTTRSGRRRRSSARPTIAVVVICVLAALELGVRVIDDRLPEPLEWHSFEVQRKVEQMDQLAADGVDVVFLGTSMMNAAAIPSTFESTVGDDLTAYNAALSSGTPRLMESWAMSVVLPRLRPRLVVIGVSSIDMTDAGVARTAFFDAFRHSPGGLRALGEESVVDHVDRWLRDHLAAWEHRAELRDPAAILDAVRGTDAPVDPVAASMDARGHLTNLYDHRFEDRPERDGIAGVSVWSLGHDDPAALARLATGARATGARVVLVELPITAEYLGFHPRGAADYAEFERAIAELAGEVDAPLLDLDEPREHRFFADELHLNRDGAVAFTTTLAGRLRADGLLP